MNTAGLLSGAALSLVIAVVITLLVRSLVRLVERTLPQWTPGIALERLARTYPNKTLPEIVLAMSQRDRIFTWMVKFLPAQCLVAMLLLATLWGFVIPKTSLFWVTLVKNLFLFEFMVLALYPTFRLIHRMQRLTIARLRELLEKS